MKNERKSAAVSLEMSIGIALAAVVVVVALALFNDNLAAMVLNTKSGNVYKANSERTSYSEFNRDYSNSQINVQLVGEQGLSMLRKKANNKVIDLLKENFSETNSNANSIAYLSTAIKALTGEPDICVYMKKESEKHCDQDDLGGYSYTINIASNTIVIYDVDSEKTIELKNINPIVASILSENIVPIDIFTKISKFSKLDKFKFIKKITDGVAEYIRADVKLVSAGSVYKSVVAKDTSKLSVSSLGGSLGALLDSLSSSVNNAHRRCAGLFDWSNGNSGCTSAFLNGIAAGSNIGYVDSNEASKYASDVSLIKTLLNDYDGNDYAEAINIVLKNPKMGEMITIMKNDHKNDPNSCTVFKEGIQGLVDKYKVSLSVPECTPNYTK